MSSEFDRIYLARNRVKKPHKVYLYEAEINMLRGLSHFLPNKVSVSDTVHAIVALTLVRAGKDFSYLKDKDKSKIKALCRALA